MTGEEIVALLEQTGPLTGAQLVERTQMEVLALWHACQESTAIRFGRAGRRFLRLDRAVPGFARLSPSIRREFLTYTLLGLDGQHLPLSERAAALGQEIRQISEAKRELARESMESAIDSISEAEVIRQKACFIIAGDITYEMSHTVPRPEKSTGEMVRGSDLDIVVVTQDDLSSEALRALDWAIYAKKHFLLIHPDYREEVDYLIKDVSRVREQLRFDNFEHMVASKILDEGQMLCGSPAVFQMVKNLVEEYGVPGKLRSLEQQAVDNRELAVERLLERGRDLSREEAFHLFYTREEGEEIY